MWLCSLSSSRDAEEGDGGGRPVWDAASGQRTHCGPWPGATSCWVSVESITVSGGVWLPACLCREFAL